MEEKENKDEKYISNNYEDYKYIYTGYQDYCKKHKIDLAEEKEAKKEEKIIHDHNYEFDFDNPNEHQHDYSFEDIPKNNNQVNNASNYNSNRTYSNNSSSSIRSYPNNKTYNLNNKNDTTIVVVSLVVVFLVVMVLTTLFSLISEYTDDYYDDTYVEYDYIEEYEYMLDDYFDAIIYDDVYYIDNYFLDVERDTWINTINTVHDNITNILRTNYIYDCYYDYEDITYNYDIDMTTIESYYSIVLNEEVNVNDYYAFMVTIYDYDDNDITSFYVVFALINDDWYLIQ